MNNVDTRPFYYSQVRVDPKNPDRVYFSSHASSRCRTTAARRTMNAAQSVHVDDHGIWIDPNDPERWFLANDGGIAITFDKGGNFWYPMNLPDRPVLRRQLRLRTCRTTSAPARRTTARGAVRAGGAARRRTTRSGSRSPAATASTPRRIRPIPNMVWGESQNAGIQQTNLKTGERGRVNKPTWNERYRAVGRFDRHRARRSAASR